MSETGQIYELLNTIAAEIPAIKKADKNIKQGYNYRGIDRLANTIRPLLVKHKLIMTSRVTHRETQHIQTGKSIFWAYIEIDWTFIAPDGSSITSNHSGEGMDYGGDKASNKARTSSYKDCLEIVFRLSETSMVDSESDEFTDAEDDDQPSYQHGPRRGNIPEREPYQSAKPAQSKAQQVWWIKIQEAANGLDWDRKRVGEFCREKMGKAGKELNDAECETFFGHIKHELDQHLDQMAAAIG